MSMRTRAREKRSMQDLPLQGESQALRLEPRLLCPPRSLGFWTAKVQFLPTTLRQVLGAP